MKEIKSVYSLEKKEKDLPSNLTTYQLKVNKKKWLKFKGISYLLGFNSVNECLNHLIDDCVKRGDNAHK